MQICRALLTASLYASLAQASAPNGPWDAFNYAPVSRTVRPAAVFKSWGSIANAENLLSESGEASLSGDGSFVALDFGKEVGGLITMRLFPSSNSSAFSLSFSESPIYVRPLASDDSTYPAPNTTFDGVEPVLAPLPSSLWTQPAERLRGGFRYLTIVSNSEDKLTISNITCEISFAPHVENMRDYAGYFSAKDPVFHDLDFLTKLWYAGAYTVQANVVSLHTGRQIPPVASPGWANNATLGVAGPIIVDGAKRDRAVWPGDMGIAVPTAFVSTNDLLPVKNALSTMFANINPVTGALPESGPPLSQLDSDTYHGWTLIGTHNYYLYSGDVDWLQTVWANYTKAVQFLENKSTPSGLINITGLRDWARLGGGGINAEGNAIYYKVLTNSADLATHLNDTSLASAYSTNASIVKSAFNEVFWVNSLGMYRDNDTTTLCPQDANSFAVLFNLTQNASQANSVSAGLEKNWNELGAVAPELPDTISPFIGGFELQAHFTSGNDQRAMDLLRREWGYMLYTNLSVQSTLLEGYTANGSIGYRSYRGYNYDPAYTSHAHGWSSGPTSALMFYVLGLQITTPQGRDWTLAPHTSDLSSAEGGFETPLGWFGASWKLSGKIFQINVNTPKGTMGTTIKVDGEVMRVSKENGSMSITVSGGEHSIITS
ncbi:Six-hairpin glycosidase [Fomitiporia mediterranea MF3/22]|uniref:Six-hairpin glycosidase n=1 Tax=Fomitiporia mediterranea (strain MF3/22) TaxID=694068 RepID=UPI00044086CA|nr:Six-hairpin glycosidase [Fomitiporia mediterranea MF3/22]EJD04901.1 Six-hairpin glycosidase [Fomitiporia mediterranea MF3/22]